MKSTPQTEVERACEILGSQAALADLLGVSPAVINQWIKGVRPVAPKHGPKIETATGVRCEGLCPEVDWESIRSTTSQSVPEPAPP